MLRQLQCALFSFCGSFIFMIAIAWLLGTAVVVSNLADFLLYLTALSAAPTLFFSVFYFRRLLQISVRASLLGCAFAIGCVIYYSSRVSDPWHLFGCYVCVVSLFHFGEYVGTAYTCPRTLKIDSFLLNHSVEYWVAALCGWTEFALESYLVPGMKSSFVSYLGVAFVVFGESMRKGAMLTARSNFTHLISQSKRPDHYLITHGVYSIFRHPAYVGWFWWSIGTQLILCNPFCCVAYAVASWRFFDSRIAEEELYLLNFFGVDYVRYQQRVPVGLPFITGYVPEM